jgi:hypothetical protein
MKAVGMCVGGIENRYEWRFRIKMVDPQIFKRKAKEKKKNNKIYTNLYTCLQQYYAKAVYSCARNNIEKIIYKNVVYEIFNIAFDINTSSTSVW